MSRRTAILLACLTAPAVLVAPAACSAPDTAARVDPIGPRREDFKYVAPVLSRRCGSLDCHGSTFRNMRVYGFGGQRLASAGAGLTPETQGTSVAEIDATYDSVVGLEPAIMREVVQSGGANPERLTFVRKGRGDEQHEGDRRIAPGDASDRCILAWLSNRVDEAAIRACNEGGCVGSRTDAGFVTIEQCQ